MYKLYVKQKIFKITDHYQVIDENQQPIYNVDQDFKLIGNTVNVNNIKNGRSFVIDKQLLTLMPKYDVSFNDGKTMVIKQNFAFFKKNIDIISDDYFLNLTGDLWDMNFTIYNMDEVVGYINKEFFSFNDSYVIEIIDSSFEEEMLALLIALDDMKDREKSSSRSSSHNN